MTGVLEEVRLERRLPAPATARAIRLEANLSLGRMATELGVDRVTVGRWESGTRHPRGENLRRYVELLEALSEELRS